MSSKSWRSSWLFLISAYTPMRPSAKSSASSSVGRRSPAKSGENQVPASRPFSSAMVMADTGSFTPVVRSRSLSWMTTTSRSLVSVQSSLNQSAAISSANRNAARVFSGA